MGHGSLPAAVVAAAITELDGADLRVWLYMRTHAGRNGEFSEEQAAIAKALTTSVSTVARAIRYLRLRTDGPRIEHVRETPRASVLRVVDPNAESDDQNPSNVPQREPVLHNLSSVNLDRSLTDDSSLTQPQPAIHLPPSVSKPARYPSKLTDHPPPPSVKNGGSPPPDRSKLTDRSTPRVPPLNSESASAPPPLQINQRPSGGASGGAQGISASLRGAEALIPTPRRMLERARFPWAESEHQRGLPHHAIDEFSRRLPAWPAWYVAFALWRCRKAKPENPVGFLIGALGNGRAMWTVDEPTAAAFIADLTRSPDSSTCYERGPVAASL